MIAIIGYLVLGYRMSASRLFPSNGDWRLAALNAALGTLLGLGAASAVEFALLRCWGTQIPGAVPWCELLAVWSLALLARRRTSTWQAAGPADTPRWLTAALIAGVVGCLTSLMIRMLRTPYGSHDAWAMWTYRARGLFLLDGDWPAAQVFLQATPAPDYPLALPLTTLRIGKALGELGPLAPQLVGGLYFACCLTLLFAGTTVLRSGRAAALATLLLAGTREFVKIGSGQLADVPAAALYLGCFVLFAASLRPSPQRAAQLVACGSLAGIMAWTKNEGLAIAVGLGLVATWRHRTWAYLAGAVPMLVVVGVFKLQVSLENEVIGPQRLADSLAQLVDLQRWQQIASVLAKEFVQFANGGLVIVPLVLWLMSRVTGTPTGTEPRSVRNGFAITAALTLTGTVLIYAMSPFSVQAHASWSLTRVLVQMWPTFLFVCLGTLAVNSQQPAQQPRHVQ